MYVCMYLGEIIALAIFDDFVFRTTQREMKMKQRNNENNRNNFGNAGENKLFRFVFQLFILPSFLR